MCCCSWPRRITFGSCLSVLEWRTRCSIRPAKRHRVILHYGWQLVPGACRPAAGLRGVEPVLELFKKSSGVKGFGRRRRSNQGTEKMWFGEETFLNPTEGRALPYPTHFLIFDLNVMYFFVDAQSLNWKIYIAKRCQNAHAYYIQVIYCNLLGGRVVVTPEWVETWKLPELGAKSLLPNTYGDSSTALDLFTAVVLRRITGLARPSGCLSLMGI